jgi:aminopeptidase N
MGGDGGMEYPMSTLITGNRPLNSLVGVTVHEMIHSWYHGVLGNNESLYSWMDEGFTSYASSRIMAHLFNPDNPFPNRGSYGGYINLAKSGLEEPMSTHADHFHTNFAYGAAAYSKGAVFMAMLGYVIGEEALAKGILRYWDDWKFKHPNPNDYVRVMEKVSGLELDWYKEHMMYTLKTIDYGIAEVKNAGGETAITLQRIGQFPMPIDLYITYEDGKVDVYNIPLQIMRGHKPKDADGVNWIKAESWSWTHPTYELRVPKAMNTIKRIEIDPTERLADLERGNNVWEK